MTLPSDRTYAGVLARYSNLLELPEHTRPVTLLEGDTPLIPMPAWRKNWAEVSNCGLSSRA